MPKRPGRRPKFTKAQVVAILRLYTTTTLPMCEIGKRFGCTGATIRKTLCPDYLTIEAWEDQCEDFTNARIALE